MDELLPGLLEELLSAVGEHLAAGGHSVSIVTVGGSTLVARGWIDRVTADVNIIARSERKDGRRVLVAPDPLPAPLQESVALVARDYGLASDWMNTVVGRQWRSGLPDGFLEELEWAEYGGLEVGFAGRQSLIALKLFAAVDRGPESVHVQDLLALEPTREELAEAAAWVAIQDASEVFEKMLKEVIEYVLGRS